MVRGKYTPQSPINNSTRNKHFNLAFMERKPLRNIVYVIGVVLQKKIKLFFKSYFYHMAFKEERSIEQCIVLALLRR